MKNLKAITAISVMLLIAFAFTTNLFAQDDPVKNKEENKVQTQVKEETQTQERVQTRDQN